MPNLYSVTDEDLVGWNPTQVDKDRWRFADGSEAFTPGSNTELSKRIELTLREVAKLEVVRQHRITSEARALQEKAEELCHVMYGVDLDTYLQSYDDRAEHIFKAARYSLAGGIPTPPSEPVAGGHGYA